MRAPNAPLRRLGLRLRIFACWRFSAAYGWLGSSLSAALKRSSAAPASRSSYRKTPAWFRRAGSRGSDSSASSRAAAAVTNGPTQPSEEAGW